MKKKAPHIAQPAVETTLLYERIRKLNGETLTYADMAEVTGRPLVDLAKWRCYVTSARRMALRLDGVATITVWGKGVRLLEDHELADVSEAARRRAFKAAGRVAKVLGTVGDLDALDEEQRTRFNTEVTLTALARKATSTNVAKKVLKRVAEAGGQLPAPKILDLF